MRRPLLLLLLGLLRPAESCSCSRTHPQEAFCRADVVIRAKVVGKKLLKVGSSGMLRYSVKQMKMYRGFDRVQHVQHVYTPAAQSLCGVQFHINKYQYLITGRLRDGRIHTGLCGLNERWERLSVGQKKLLNHRYQQGCSCRIRPCFQLPCVSNGDECLWTDLLPPPAVPPPGVLPPPARPRLQAWSYACLQQGGGHCSWTRGGRGGNATEP